MKYKLEGPTLERVVDLITEKKIPLHEPNREVIWHASVDYTPQFSEVIGHQFIAKESFVLFEVYDESDDRAIYGYIYKDDAWYAANGEADDAALIAAIESYRGLDN